MSSQFKTFLSLFLLQYWENVSGKTSFRKKSFGKTLQSFDSLPSNKKVNREMFYDNNRHVVKDYIEYEIGGDTWKGCSLE